MEEDVADARSKRRCTRRGQPNSQPSAVHYVGYVEDDETPEMIMAKFQALDRIQATMPAQVQEENEGAHRAMLLLAEAEEGSRDGCLSDTQLLEVFKQTSMFNVKTALADNEVLLSIDDLLGQTADRYGSDEDVSDDEDWLQSFWSTSGADREGGPKQGKESRPRPSVAGGVRTSSKARHRLITTYNPFSQAMVKRKVRISARDEVVTVRIPAPPLPLSWGRVVRHYCPEQRKATPGCGSYAAWLKQRDAGASYEAALINPGWAEAGNPEDAVKVLARLPLPALVPSGMVFIFLPKEHIQAVCRQMVSWGFVYIENLTWVHLAPNHSIRQEASPYLRSSHLTLYMFRWADRGREMELRHQRNPDVIFDCCLPAQSGVAAVPEAVYATIETLLPGARDKFLELWAAPGASRSGWAQLAFDPVS